MIMLQNQMCPPDSPHQECKEKCKPASSAINVSPGQFDDSPDDYLASSLNPYYVIYGHATKESSAVHHPFQNGDDRVSESCFSEGDSFVVSPSTSLEIKANTLNSSKPRKHRGEDELLVGRHPRLKHDLTGSADAFDCQFSSGQPMTLKAFPQERPAFQQESKPGLQCEMEPRLQGRLEGQEKSRPRLDYERPEESQGVDLDRITTITDDDVLCGRGGKTNGHKGNRQFRFLIDIARPEYFSARKPRKTQISHAIVRAIRSIGGRFLKLDKETNTYFDVGNAKAVEKTSQALREGAAQKLRDIMSTNYCHPLSSLAPFTPNATVASNKDENAAISCTTEGKEKPTSILRSPKKRWLEEWEMAHDADEYVSKRQHMSLSA